MVLVIRAAALNSLLSVSYCENVNKSNWVDCTACYGKGIITIKNKVESNTIYESH